MTDAAGRFTSLPEDRLLSWGVIFSSASASCWGVTALVGQVPAISHLSPVSGVGGGVVGSRMVSPLTSTSTSTVICEDRSSAWEAEPLSLSLSARTSPSPVLAPALLGSTPLFPILILLLLLVLLSVAVTLRLENKAPPVRTTIRTPAEMTAMGAVSTGVSTDSIDGGGVRSLVILRGTGARESSL